MTCSQITANRTAAYCVKIIPGTSVQHILLGFNYTRSVNVIVSIDSGHSSMRPGNKPFPEAILIQLYVAIWRH